jgi:pilus assembly protein CpaE
MLHALLITNDAAAAELLSRVIRQTGQIILDQNYSAQPTHYQLTRSLHTLPLDVIFVDVRDRGHVEQVQSEIEKKAKGTALVGFSTEPDGARNGGLPYVLQLPLSTGGLLDTVRGAVRSAHPRPLGNLVSLVSTKGGAGATSITLNVAAHLSKAFKKNVLVAEADLRFGTMSDWINARCIQTMGQSLACADSCVSLIWPRHICRKFGVDWMLTGRERNLPQVHWFDYDHLLRFVSSRYDYTLVDLPHFLDDAASEVVHLSQTVFVVTTAEVLSLRLARQRIDELEGMGVPKPRIRLLVNRLESRDLQPDDIRRTLACELGGVFPNDYPAVSNAILEGEFVRDNSRLGRAYRSFAGAIAGETRPTLDLESARSLFGAFLGSRRASAVMTSLLAQKQ